MLNISQRTSLLLFGLISFIHLFSSFIFVTVIEHKSNLETKGKELFGLQICVIVYHHGRSSEVPREGTVAETAEECFCWLDSSIFFSYLSYTVHAHLHRIAQPTLGQVLTHQIAVRKDVHMPPGQSDVVNSSVVIPSSQGSEFVSH